VTTAAECQNCGAALTGAYCSACGQKRDVRILSLPAFIGDVVADLHNVDSRIWRTLATLVFKPGRLTRLYIEGQRAKYTPPFRLYVVTSVTFFLVFSLSRALSPDDAADVADQTEAAAVTPAPAGARESANDAAGDAALENDQTFSINIDDDDLECKFNPDGLSPAVRERFKAACERVEDANAASFNRAFADNFPVTMLVFIPIVAAIMKLLYLFARRKYVEHLLFFLHVHTFFFLVALLTVLLSDLAALAPAFAVPAWIVGAVAWGYFLVYLYTAMREVYRQDHRLTAVKYFVLGGSYFAAALLTALGAVIFTALTL
jgi:hypothetical protein